MNLRATVLSMLLVTSVLGAAAAPAATQQAEGEAYSGTFVQFETGNAAVTDYAVDGSVVVESVRAQSASETEGGIGVDAGASSSTSISGSAVSTGSQGDASASVAFESGTDMEAHDNQRGVVTFTASDGDQVVQANVSGDASSEGDSRVVVQGDDGAQGTFIVVGDGNVTTNADGQVTARVEEDSQLVYRQYNDERSDSEKTQEEMIQNGKATAEVYVYAAAESGEDGEENAESVVTYGQDTNAEVQERSQDRINVTVERTESQGKVLITTVSESAVENAESLEVYVDGEAAAQAESYSDVRAATEGADQSRYMVRQSGSAEAAVDVIVGINEFSERTVSMQSAGDGGESTATDGDDGMGGDDTDGDGTDGDAAGFGVLAALVALAAALIAVRKRS
jgi:hypothetical protein